MRLGREQATGFVEDVDADPIADPIASAELTTDAPALAQRPPDPHPEPAIIAG